MILELITKNKNAKIYLLFISENDEWIDTIYYGNIENNYAKLINNIRVEVETKDRRIKNKIIVIGENTEILRVEGIYYEPGIFQKLFNKKRFLQFGYIDTTGKFIKKIKYKKKLG